jgi:large-conductance mechanosensitive channel
MYGDIVKKMLVIALIVGLVITIITGFINTTPSGILGATWYGWPLAWKTVPVVVEPEANYDILKFIGDVIVWFIVAFVVMFAVDKIRK